MTSLKKSLDQQKQSTLFSDLSHVEKQTSKMARNLLENIQVLKRVSGQFKVIEKEGRKGDQQFGVKATKDMTSFEQKLKGYLGIQKGQFSRLASQVNSIMVNHKEINSQLQILSSRFQEYRKNVGL